MSIAMKNGSVILQGGSVAESCGCCGCSPPIAEIEEARNQMVAAGEASLVSISVTGSAIYPSAQSLVPSQGRMQLVSTSSPYPNSKHAFFRQTYVASSHYFVTETLELNTNYNAYYISFGVYVFYVFDGLNLAVGTLIGTGGDEYFFSRFSAGRVIVGLADGGESRLLQVGYGSVDFRTGDFSLSVGNVSSGGAVDWLGSPTVFCDAAQETFRFPIAASHLAFFNDSPNQLAQRKFRVSYEIQGQAPLALKAG